MERGCRRLARIEPYRDRVYAKWCAAYEALVDRVQPLLHDAANAAQRGAFNDAEAACRRVLEFSQNDPWALNLLAMVERRTGRLAQARRTQALAVDVRPGDAGLVYNLALLCRDGGELASARLNAAQASALAPENEKYRALVDALSATAPNVS
jgi:Flp pilus assembly protein TadD